MESSFNSIVHVFLSSSYKQFAYYQSLGEKTIAQLPDEALFWQPNPQTNSIAIIVNHLSGNMLSRWTDFLSTDGEKTWRQRETEFDDILQDRPTLLARWTQGWTCLHEALDTITVDNFDTIIYIRNHGHSIPEAINRQLCHYAYHVGQIVHIGKTYLGTDWASLSIPRGQSQAYNADKFAKEKRRTHFTDDL